MNAAVWLLILMAAAVGHFGLHVAIYNRINGFGWPRKVVKTIVKFFFATTILIPLVVIYLYWPILADMLSGSPDIDIPTPLRWYGTVCLAAWIVLGVPWLIWRPLFATRMDHGTANDRSRRCPAGCRESVAADAESKTGSTRPLESTA